MTQPLFKLFGAIQKVDDNDDGTITVHGIASSPSRDHAGEIVSADAMKAALPGYSKFPALREMHQPMAAGKVLEAEVDDEGITHIAAHVVDPIAIVKVRTGVYSGFSIGGKILKRDPNDRTIITAMRLVEISLVDSPCNPDAVLSMWKADMIDFKPSSADTIERAKTLAKAAGSARFKDFLFEASQELIAEHLIEKGELAPPEAEPEAGSAPEAPETAAVASTEAPEAPEAPEVNAEAPAAAEAPEAETIEASAQIDPEDDDAGGEGPEGPEAKEAAAEPDPAAALANAIEKGKETLESAIAPAAAIEAPAGPFADLEKAAAALRAIQPPSDLAKSLWHVSRLADLLDSFACLQRCVAYEAAEEGDGSPIPAQLAEQVKATAALLVAMATEEVSELIASSIVVVAEGESEPDVEIVYVASDGVEAETIELAGQIIDLAKADEAGMAAAAERLAKLAPQPEPDADLVAKAARTDELEAENTALKAQMAEAAPAVEDMAKRFGDTIEGLKGEIADLTTKFDALDQTPLPAKTAGPAAVRTIAKGDDSTGQGAGAEGLEGLGGLTTEQFQKAWDGLSEEDRGQIMLRVALANPTAIALPRTA